MLNCKWPYREPACSHKLLLLGWFHGRLSSLNVNATEHLFTLLLNVLSMFWYYAGYKYRYITVGKTCGAEAYNPFLSRFATELQSLRKILWPNYFSSTHITVVSIFTFKTNFPNPIMHWEFFVCFCFLTIKENLIDHVFLSSKLLLVLASMRRILKFEEKGHSERLSNSGA